MSDVHASILVNGEPVEVPSGCTVASLLEILKIEGGRVAVALNRDVVPRSRFDEHAIGTGDRIEILEAVGGG